MKKQDEDKRAEQIADAIGELPEQMICEALDFGEKVGRQKRKRRHRIEIFSALAAAAVICIVVLHGGDYAFIQKQTENIDKTEKKIALRESDQKKDISEENLDIWCMESGLGVDMEGVEYFDDQDSSLGNKDVKKESGRNVPKDSQDAVRDTEKKGEQLKKGEKYRLDTNITGSGKDRSVQFTLQFGETDDSVRYQLKASVVSMDLIAEEDTAENRVTLQGNTAREITCVSGTQIGCSIRVADIAKGKVTPSISVTKENKDTGEKIKAEIKVKQKSGKYYLYLTEK